MQNVQYLKLSSITVLWSWFDLYHNKTTAWDYCFLWCSINDVHWSTSQGSNAGIKELSSKNIPN